MKVDLKKAAASALSFAHLAGIGGKPAAKSRAAEDDDKKDDGERDHEDGDAKDKRAEEGDDKEKADDKDKNYARADDETDDEQAEDDKPEGDDDDKKSKSKSKASDEDKKDDDPDEEMRGNSTAAVARRREQARCASIFASSHAARNPVLAANLAFKTRMSRSEALAVLEATPTGAAAPTNASRASRNPNVGSGTNTQQSSQQSIATGWDAAFKKVQPRR